MLVQPWDAAENDDEWRSWLADGRDFGELITKSGPDGWPVVVPTHFVFDGNKEILVHLARGNPIWRALEIDPHVIVSVVGDYAYVPTTWRAAEGVRAVDGVPTSYYAAVQLFCSASMIDDPATKADLLRRQLEHFQPAGDFADVVPDAPPYGRLLSGIRGISLQVESVRAKFKYDDHRKSPFQNRVAELLAERSEKDDVSARAQLLRRSARYE